MYCQIGILNIRNSSIWIHPFYSLYDHPSNSDWNHHCTIHNGRNCLYFPLYTTYTDHNDRLICLDQWIEHRHYRSILRIRFHIVHIIIMVSIHVDIHHIWLFWYYIDPSYQSDISYLCLDHDTIYNCSTTCNRETEHDIFYCSVYNQNSIIIIIHSCSLHHGLCCDHYSHSCLHNLNQTLFIFIFIFISFHNHHHLIIIQL